MTTAPYNGIFLAPETIVVFPGFSAAQLDTTIPVREAEGLAVSNDVHPHAAACAEQPVF